eukprot:31311-Pelagococcus_subviridis.AAC.14
MLVRLGQVRALADPGAEHQTAVHVSVRVPERRGFAEVRQRRRRVLLDVRVAVKRARRSSRRRLTPRLLGSSSRRRRCRAARLARARTRNKTARLESSAADRNSPNNTRSPSPTTRARPRATLSGPGTAPSDRSGLCDPAALSPRPRINADARPDFARPVSRCYRTRRSPREGGSTPRLDTPLRRRRRPRTPPRTPPRRPRTRPRGSNPGPLAPRPSACDTAPSRERLDRRTRAGASSRARTAPCRAPSPPRADNARAPSPDPTPSARVDTGTSRPRSDSRSSSRR